MDALMEARKRQRIDEMSREWHLTGPWMRERRAEIEAEIKRLEECIETTE